MIRKNPFCILGIAILIVSMCSNIFTINASEPSSENYKKGVESFNNWDYDSAFDYFIEAQNDCPGNGYVYYYLSQILYLSEMVDQSYTLAYNALNCFTADDKKGIADTYMHLGFLAQYGYLYNFETDLSANEYYDMAIQWNPDDYHTWLTRGIYYDIYKEEYEKALSDYENAIERNPFEVEPYTRMGQCYEHSLNDLDSAISVYKKCCATLTEYPYHHDTLSSLLIKKNEYDEAANVILAGIDMVEECMANYYSLANFPEKQKAYLRDEIGKRLEKDPTKDYLSTYLTELDGE